MPIYIRLQTIAITNVSALVFDSPQLHHIGFQPVGWNPFFMPKTVDFIRFSSFLMIN